LKKSVIKQQHRAFQEQYPKMYTEEAEYALQHFEDAILTKNITFVVTENCNLRCTYCYECGKNQTKRMTKEVARKAVDTINKIPGDSSEHYVVLGSFIQSGVYVSRTLKNKEMDEDRKKTLAINQILCFFIPTIAGYTVNKFLGKAVKKVGYRYSTLMKQRIADLKASGDAKKLEKATEINDKLGKNIKAVGSLSRLASFTLIYRYLTPVLVTPIANMLGDKHIASKKAKEEAVVAKA
jgi:hypothetical protein